MNRTFTVILNHLKTYANKLSRLSPLDTRLCMRETEIKLESKMVHTDGRLLN